MQNTAALVAERLHQLVDTVIDALRDRFDGKRAGVKDRLLDMDHVEYLIGSKQDIGELIENALRDGQVDRGHDVEFNFFFLHSAIGVI